MVLDFLCRYLAYVGQIFDDLRSNVMVLDFLCRYLSCVGQAFEDLLGNNVMDLYLLFRYLS